MSQPDLSSASPRGVLVQKPKTSIYTVMLIVAMVAILIGCLFLLLEINRYGGFGAVKGRVSSLVRPVETMVVESPASVSPARNLPVATTERLV